MYLKIIENYINKLSKDDIILFAFKNNIILKPNESDYLYNVIKNDYKILLGNNYNDVFNNAKNYIDSNKLKKIYNLYLDYREKYKFYFN